MTDPKYQFPNVVDIINGVRISGEAFSEGPMHRICISVSNHAIIWLGVFFVCLLRTCLTTAFRSFVCGLDGADGAVAAGVFICLPVAAAWLTAC